MDFENKVIDKLDAIQEDITELKVETAKQGKDIARNTEDLADHIEGVRQTRELIKSNSLEIGNLKEQQRPMTVKVFFNKILIVLGGASVVMGAVWTFMKLYEKLVGG